MLVIVVVVPVLILIMCLPVHEARRIPLGRKENKLFGAVDRAGPSTRKIRPLPKAFKWKRAQNFGKKKTKTKHSRKKKN